MKVYRDLEYIKKRKRLATLTSVAGVALLGSAFWLASTGGQSGVFIAYIPLLAGTIIFHLGMQQVGKWNRAQRNDVILDALLKDLGERYALIHYPRIGKRIVEHALVHPGGLLAITARDLPGGVAYRDGRWRKVGQGISRFFGMGGAFLGNPTTDTAADIGAVKALLAQEKISVDIDGVVAFLNPKVTLDVTEPDYPVTNAEGLKPYIASLAASSSVRRPSYEQIPAQAETIRSLPADSGAESRERQYIAGTYYQVLQVDPSADAEVIEAAYRRLALKYHPDTSSDSEASQRMREIIEARECLRDPNCRGNYDRSISTARKASKQRPRVAPMRADPGLQAADRQRVVELLTRDGTFEAPQAAPTRRPVKRRAA
jgi:hypothetical protein